MSSIESFKIPLQEILLATNRFSEANIIARGGFGKVYRGHLTQHGFLAIKRLDRSYGQGDREFGMEISLLTIYKHENLVSFVGFCEEAGEKILVYKFEANGSLDKFLHRKELTWNHRLQICIDAARGLRYLHDGVGSQHRVIHGDIKSSNILLDENWKAKISDFGLSKIGLAHVPFSVLYTNPRGTYGYIDPELMNGALTQKSDVYSFGVVLFEVLFGKLVSVPGSLDDRHFTVEMAKNHYENDTLDEMIDPDLHNEMSTASLRTFSTIAFQCLRNRRDDRPKMRLVVEELVKALGHQQVIEFLHKNKALYGFSHDVYISVAKEDCTPPFFINNLCAALEKNGLCVYKDNIQDSCKKSALVAAIEHSRSSVIIFSKYFANNTWNLDEAAKIIECLRERKQVVLPIYFQLDFSDVRGQSGAFEEILYTFFADRRIGAFRNALGLAGSLGGLQCDGYWSLGVAEEAALKIRDRLSDCNYIVNVTCSHDDDSRLGFEEVNLVPQRGLKSMVWKFFKKVKKPDGETVAICNHCNANFVGDVGTSHLRNHLMRRHQEIIGNSESSYKFNQERSRNDLAIMVIKHNYTLSIVDHHWFNVYSHGLNPNLNIISRNTIGADIISIHKEEKQKMQALLENLPCKVTLTSDIWTSDHQNIAYTCLTAHFIDDNWDLKKKIIAYRYIQYPHDGQTLFKVIRDLILEWNISKNIFAIVADNASSNDVMVKLLKDWLEKRSSLSLDGSLFHVTCSANMLNLVVQDGLKIIRTLIKKVRHSARYLENSTYAKQKFDNAVNQLRLKGKKELRVDVPYIWSSTYSMLEIAISMREAFERLSDLDRFYKFNPTKEEWEVATTVEDCLKVFYDATNHIRGSNFPTSNVFFRDVCNLQLKLCKWEQSEIDYLRICARCMKEKFVKYWDKCCLLLAISVMFDPRFKLEMVTHYYTRIYGDEAETYVTRVCRAFHDLFKEYNNSRGEMHTCSVHSNVSQSHDMFGVFFKCCEKEDPCASYQEYEVDVYLKEPLLPQEADFQLLQWWKINSIKYPVLAKVARDVLAVPVTTVVSESALSIGGRKIDETRSSMLPELVEALVTTADWIEEKQ